MAFIYKKSVIGGTFDHFHLGHQKLIDAAFEQSEHVTIGLALPPLYEHKLFAHAIQDYATREKTLKQYIHEKKLEDRAEIIPIKTIYGNTLKEHDIDAIFATEENKLNVALINTKRKEINFPELEIIIVEYVLDNRGEKITSERIRKGEIDRDGNIYADLFIQKSTVTLPENLREELQKPIGDVVKETTGLLGLLTNQTLIIAVGDIIASELKNVGLVAAINIIDFKSRRQELLQTVFPNTFTTTNAQGTIEKNAIEALEKALAQYWQTKETQTIIVDGEEDLLALPAILLAPLDAMVLYGQFGEGIVVNSVTQELKQKIVEIVKRFN